MGLYVGHGRGEGARVEGRGKTKTSVEYNNGFRAQLWVHPPERFGTALQYATGSKDHNVKIRELALDQGYSLSEHALTKEDGTEVLCDREEKVYQTLGLPFIPPELREDRGEVQAAGRQPVGNWRQPASGRQPRGGRAAGVRQPRGRATRGQRCC